MKITQLTIILGLSFLPLISQGSIENIKQEVLDAHNGFRAMHDAPALQWDDTLAQYAERHANECLFQHTHGPHGENLAAGYRTPRAAISAWYAENQYYSYSNPKFSSNTGHFTQVVWKSTKRVGCAFVSCNGKKGTPGMYLVCEYSPAGNITNPGYFAQNVTPPHSVQAKAGGDEYEP